ncbi:hypothetical protein ES703_32919 [subsurface metagenome]
MGTGVGGVSAEDAAGAMVRAIREFIQVAKTLKDIILCDRNKEMVDARSKELSK